MMLVCGWFMVFNRALLVYGDAAYFPLCDEYFGGFGFSGSCGFADMLDQMPLVFLLGLSCGLCVVGELVGVLEAWDVLSALHAGRFPSSRQMI